jgi:hypothetical protein
MGFSFSFQDILDISFDQNQQESPLSEFHFFPKLPTEVRLQIWALARPTARLIHANIETECQFEVPGDVCSKHFHLAIVGRKAPSVLHVCKESRDFFLPTYTSSFDSTRTPFPVQYRPQNWRHSGRRGNPTYHDDALSNMFFPCHHEALVSNKESTMYWDPENDIILLRPTYDWGLNDKQFLAGTAFLWSGHGWTAPKIHGVKKLAVEFNSFKHWVPGILPEDPIFDEAKIIYVILTRRRIDGDAEWERHLTKFMCWYQQIRVNHPSGFVEERKFDWEVRVAERSDGYPIWEGSFEEAVSEHDIEGWKNDPCIGTWLADEESWRD